jgi:hypothetical protein
MRYRLVLLASLSAGVLASACTHPIGPGFQFADRQTEIREDAASPGQLDILVTDRFQNIGGQPLSSLEVQLPDSVTSDPPAVRITIDGRAGSSKILPFAEHRMLRTGLDPAWTERESHEIRTEWNLVPGIARGGAAETSPDAFYITSPIALPLWQPPSGPFTGGDADPDKATLTVSVPVDYRVLAPGKRLGERSDPGESTYRFRLQPEADFRPYVIAGRYQERDIRAARGTVSFWTFGPLDASQAEKAANRLASSARAFADYFGSSYRIPGAVHIVEARGKLPQDFGAGNAPGGESFPLGVLLDERAFALGIASEDVLQFAEYQLVQTWFGWTAQPSEESQFVMQSGLGMFGWVIAAEDRGAQDRLNIVASLLARYDAARRAAPDKALIAAPDAYGREESLTTTYKAALFFVALEDACGSKNLRASFRSILSARTGADVTYEDLLAAAEAASRLNLAELFRTWFNRPGDVPENFRARYASSTSAQISN